MAGLQASADPRNRSISASQGGTVLRQRAAFVLWLLLLHAAAAAACGHTSESLSNEHHPQTSNGRAAASARSLQQTSSCAGGGPATPQRAVQRSDISTNAAEYSIPANIMSLAKPRHTTGQELWFEGTEPNSSDNTQALDTVGDAAEGLDSIGPSSACKKDYKFSLAGDSDTTCRLVVNDVTNESFLCTAWFIGPQHVATAGHCVSDQGAYSLLPTNPGFLCCSFDRTTGFCKRQYTWKLVQWVTTKGFLETYSSDNDGAVIEVAPVNAGDYVPGVVQKLTSFFPNPVTTHQVYMDGYPAAVPGDVGCQGVNNTRRYQTHGQVKPKPGSSGPPSSAVEYWGVSGCAGESGGRVLIGGPKGPAYGLQTYGLTSCDSGHGLTGVTQITLTPQNCGVCLPSLMTALRSNARG